MWQKVLFIPILATLSSLAFGQEDWRLYSSEVPLKEDTFQVFKNEPLDSGSIEIFNPSGLDSLIQAFKTHPPSVRGYRVLVYLGTSRKNADQARSLYLQQSLSYPVYFEFNDPNFSVEIGDFYTRLEAEKTLHELDGFSSSAYIVIRSIKNPFTSSAP
jgi:hypothetical protein